MQQAADFLDESLALSELIAPLSDTDYTQKTAFKDWTIDMVLRHLHFWNTAALLSVKDEAAFQALVSGLTDAKAHFQTMNMRTSRACQAAPCGRTGLSWQTVRQMSSLKPIHPSACNGWAQA